MNPPWLATQEQKVCSLEHSEVITVNGTLNGRNARLLLDSGASGNFISQSFINSIMNEASENVGVIGEIKSTDSKNVRLADGTLRV